MFRITEQYEDDGGKKWDRIYYIDMTKVTYCSTDADDRSVYFGFERADDKNIQDLSKEEFRRVQSILDSMNSLGEIKTHE